MLKSTMRWKENSGPSAHTAMGFGVSPLVEQLLIQRGITSAEDAKRFLRPSLEDLHRPEHLRDIDVAAERIHAAIAQEEKILVFGDYDADGVSSTVVLLEALRELGADCDYYIPNRFTEGYGPNEEAFRAAKDNGYGLIITVDTGIAANHEAEVAKQIGIDLIITDHHEVQESVPAAIAVVHPKCSPDYPFHELAGVGVAFKLAEYLLGYFPKQLLDLVVIGTIADLVPLVDENRILAAEGLKAITSSQRPGIRALKDSCGLDGMVTEEDIGFKIGPRINAVGRLQDADLAVELLLAATYEEAAEMAEEMQSLNTERQNIVAKIAKEAEAMVREQPEADSSHVIVVAKEGWNEGVLGIVASKLVRTFDRPAIVLAAHPEKGTAKGSARSIDAFDLFHHCMQVRDHFVAFGGHAQAAGMTVELEQVDKLRKALNKAASEALTPEDFKQSLSIDLEVNVQDVSIDLIKDMSQLAPFGMQNPKPLVKLSAPMREVKLIGANKNHLKFVFAEENVQLDGVCFGKGDLYPFLAPADELEAVGELSINEWNGRQKAQILIEDIAVRSWQLFDYRGSKQLQKTVQLKQEEETAVIRFRADTDINWLSEQVRVLDYETEGLANAAGNITAVVLADLPHRLEDITFALRHLQPDLIYACYDVKENAYLQGFPDREQFKIFYAILLKQKVISYQQLENHLKNSRGWSAQRTKFISEVFFELEFVKLDKDQISINQSPSKRDLADSQVYQGLKEAIEVEKILYYSGYNDLKQWLEHALERGEVIEEEAVNGL
ncbi:single-stranded-DNA-specific exonuclease RecJ [Terribacillus sp. DMT04]|uniref:single-stranded-DNA-specific exonuclease RecJ n=1 Tax=Terribacillus sp. DMT04 TaxID=2850441 RepID=UPI001C2C3841|nr:single-stranded-DNA-specific exonuclease RecJ [Terribacillus sp. DMT04]QXE00528.1 single-stranded-DNA-specific exonuclease RecJ [Terribacillus sp. DMT04]